jgi:hypothetical protein
MGGGTHESEQDVDELLAFAADCWPDATGTRLYGALEAGRRLSPLELQYLLNQKAQWWLRRRSWRYRGY